MKDEGLESRLANLESKLIEQDHRLFPVFLKFWNRKSAFPDGDPRRTAAVKALFFAVLFSPASIAAGGSVLAIISLACVVWQTNVMRDNNELALASNRLLQEANHLAHDSYYSVVFAVPNAKYSIQGDRYGYKEDSPEMVLSEGIRLRAMLLSGENSSCVLLGCKGYCHTTEGSFRLDIAIDGGDGGEKPVPVITSGTATPIYLTVRDGTPPCCRLGRAFSDYEPNLLPPFKHLKDIEVGLVVFCLRLHAVLADGSHIAADLSFPGELSTKISDKCTAQQRTSDEALQKVKWSGLCNVDSRWEEHECLAVSKMKLQSRVPTDIPVDVRWAEARAEHYKTIDLALSDFTRTTSINSGDE